MTKDKSWIIHPGHTGTYKCAFCHRTFKSIISARRHESAKHRKQIKKLASKQNVKLQKTS